MMHGQKNIKLCVKVWRKLALCVGFLYTALFPSSL